MAARSAWADVVICRSGALTVAELAAAGVGSVLVPFPHAVDDHQTGNAKFLSQAGAAYWVPQAGLNVDKLVHMLCEIPRAKWLEMAEKARALGKPESANVVADICESLISKKNSPDLSSESQQRET